jgi:hypothetical protein
MSLPTPDFDPVVEQTIAALRRNYQDAVRLSAREEILAELAEDGVTARLHADTARFHHGSARAYARTLELLVGEELDLYEDKEQMRHATRETDLAHMRCQGRRYRVFDPNELGFGRRWFRASAHWWVRSTPMMWCTGRSRRGLVLILKKG